MRMMIQGTKAERETMISMLLYTSKVLGLNLSFEKGTRGTRITWIGVTLEVDQEAKEIILEIPKKLVEDLLEKLKGWKGLIPLKDLRSTAFKLSWAAGIFPRLRWAVSICDGVVADGEEGTEETSAAKCSEDSRPKPGLIAAKRLELARRWLCHPGTGGGLEGAQDPDMVAANRPIMSGAALNPNSIARNRMTLSPSGWGAKQ